ncbi:MAG: hypothetical protein MZU97_12025 [Bacillus subtilis]|nr:hypothetical protein [Bacillus subtilis]
MSELPAGTKSAANAAPGLPVPDFSVRLSWPCYSGRLFLSPDPDGAASSGPGRPAFPGNPACIPAQRGEIYDRGGQRPAASSTWIPSPWTSVRRRSSGARCRDTVFLKLAAELTGRPVEELSIRQVPAVLATISTSPSRSVGAVPLTTVIVAVAERHRSELPGVTWHDQAASGTTSRPVRSSHVIGYVGDITREELKLLLQPGISTYRRCHRQDRHRAAVRLGAPSGQGRAVNTASG